MKRWNGKTHIENPKVDVFLNDLIDVCKEHNLSLSHEDLHGAFQVVPYDDSFKAWLEQAMDKTGENLK